MQALNVPGNVLVTQRDFERARPLYEEQLRLARDKDNRGDIVIALNNLGVVVREGGDLERARALHTEALAISESTTSKTGIAWATRNLGAVALLAGEYEAAAACFTQSLALRWELMNSDQRRATTTRQDVAGSSTGCPSWMEHVSPRPLTAWVNIPTLNRV